MPFVKGQSRPPGAGRRKGSKNKVSAPRLREQMAEEGFSIAGEAKKLLSDPKASFNDKLTLLQWLTDWTQTKPSVDEDLDDDELDLDEAEANLRRIR